MAGVPAGAVGGGDGPRGADLTRFGIAADRLPEKLLPQLPDLVERARTRFVILSAFDVASPVENAREALAARAPTIDRLLGHSQELTLAVTGVPPSIATRETIDATDALAFCERPAPVWSAYLEPTLDVYGQRILRYQLGAVGDTHALRRDASAALESFEKAISKLVPGPRLALSWRADYALPRPVRQAADGSTKGRSSLPLCRTLSCLYPLGFAPAGMRELRSAWDRQSEGGAEELTVVCELPDADRFGPRARVVETARRVAEFWAAFSGSDASIARAGPPARLALDEPWRVATVGTEDRLLPGPDLAVLAVMADRLAGRRVVGTIPTGAGVRALLLAEPADGGSTSGLRGAALARACVIAWAESADAEHAAVDIYPGKDGVQVTDIFGNTSSAPIPAGKAGVGGGGLSAVQVRVQLTESPVFIEGVDPYLAQLMSSIQLTPTFIPAVVSEHEHHVEITNPWPVRITGQLQVREAEAATGGLAAGGAGAGPKVRSAPWTISPPLIDFAIAPGETASLPLTISFGSGQLAGTKDLAISVRVLADRQYPALRTTTTVEVGLAELELVVTAQVGPTATGPDVVVQAAVTNRGQRPRTLRVDLAARDTPGQQLEISDLPGGQTVYKRFVIRDGAKPLAGRYVKVTLSDDESAARLSKAALVPDVR